MPEQPPEKKGVRPLQDQTEKRSESPTKVETNQPVNEKPSQESGIPEQRPVDTRATEGIARLEQLKRGTIPDQRPPESGEQPLSNLDQTSRRNTGPGIPDDLAKEWMSRVEADPGQVLRRQFEVEERREWEQNAGRLMETRPW
ncbi:hypothetical protein CCP3SC1_1950001 [Gammaproteobacteria bacterium]